MLAGMDDRERDELRQRLAEVEERIERAGGRLAFGYGTEGDRDGWALWLTQLVTQRDELRTALGEVAGELPGAGMEPR
jgi:hypothetical protein